MDFVGFDYDEKCDALYIHHIVHKTPLDINNNKQQMNAACEFRHEMKYTGNVHDSCEYNKQNY